MKDTLLYYVAVPYTEEVLNLITLFSIDVGKYGLISDYPEDLGLFIYNTRLFIESIDDETEWLLEVNDAIHVLAFYANRDFKSICEYLNNMPNKPFTVYIDAGYLTYTI